MTRSDPPKTIEGTVNKTLAAADLRTTCISGIADRRLSRPLVGCLAGSHPYAGQSLKSRPKLISSCWIRVTAEEVSSPDRWLRLCYRL